MTLRSEFINENFHRMNTFKLKKFKLKKDIPYMNFRETNDYYNKLYGSRFLKQLRVVVPFFSEPHAFYICKRLLDYPYYFINDMQVFRRRFACHSGFDFYLDDEHNCKNCGFTHYDYDIVGFRRKYPLITVSQISEILEKCKSTGPLNPIVTTP